MISNWAQTHVFAAPRLIEATNIEQVRAAVSSGDRIRALGTRHSFNDLPDTIGTLITVTDIPANPVLDEKNATVAVGAGTRYGVLAAWLEKRGWALHNLGSLPHISIAGAVATGTHGSGNRNGSLATAVRAIEYVDASGEVVAVNRGEPGFAGLIVGLGAYGVVVRVTLDIEPSYRIRQDIYRGMPWEAYLEELDAVMGDAYSVSAFTDWLGPAIGQVWRKTRLVDDAQAVPERWLGAIRDRHAAQSIIAGVDDNLTRQGGEPGPWSERLPHFRLDSTPSAGDEIQTEYFVDRSRGADALRAIRSLSERILPHLLISELRTVAEDELWLSGAFGRQTLAIHFTWRNEPDAVRALLPDLESALAEFDARPHWGKLHGFDAQAIARVTPRLGDARALFEELDPRGTFSNAHLERLGVRSPR